MAMPATKFRLILQMLPACGGSNEILENRMLPFMYIAGESNIAVGGTGPEGASVAIVNLMSFWASPDSGIER